MSLLLDEMYPPSIAEQLRSRGFDVISVHDADYRHLRRVSDEEVFAAAVALERAVVTENVSDYRRLETNALARGERCPSLIYTTDRQFPRGDPGAVGQIVLALARLLGEQPFLAGSVFLKRAP